MVTLALGIGATTAIFSVVYSVLIKPLPYPNADQLGRIRHTATSGLDFSDASLTTSPSMYFTYRAENRTFAELGLWWELRLTMTGAGDPERVRGLLVSHGTLQALGVQPLLGRLFTEAEHTPAAEGPLKLERMFLLHGLALTALGGVVGLAVALALGRLMSSLLFGLAPTDVTAYVGAAIVTIAAAALASHLPARRASSIDRVETLRAE